MPLVLGREWGPYHGPADALAYTSKFVDKCCGRDVGIVWVANGAIYPLRAAKPDKDGNRDFVVFEWTYALPRPARPPTDYWSRVKRFIRHTVERMGENRLAEIKADMAVGQALQQLIGRATSGHAADGTAVALDVLCVALTIVSVVTVGPEVIGLVALGGGVFLLLADSTILGLELSGDEERAEAVKKTTEVPRVLATIATLPDALFVGFRKITELREVTQAIAVDQTTARAAENIGARTANADRARRAEQIAERAHLRMQFRTQQIRGLWYYELAPRAAGLGGAGLLLSDQIRDDKSLLREIAGRLRVHTCTRPR